MLLNIENFLCQDFVLTCYTNLNVLGSIYIRERIVMIPPLSVVLGGGIYCEAFSPIKSFFGDWNPPCQNPVRVCRRVNHVPEMTQQFGSCISNVTCMMEMSVPIVGYVNLLDYLQVGKDLDWRSIRRILSIYWYLYLSIDITTFLRLILLQEISPPTHHIAKYVGRPSSLQGERQRPKRRNQVNQDIQTDIHGQQFYICYVLIWCKLVWTTNKE